MLRSFALEMDRDGTRAHRITLLLIICMGFLLRLHGLHAGQGFYHPAINDEILAYRAALALLAGEGDAWYLGQPTFAGGQVPGPLWALYWAGSWLLGSRSIEGAMLVTILLNTLTIYLVYRLARKLFDSGLALLVALLYATAPWTIFFSVGLWNPLPLAFLGVLLFLSLWQVTQHPQSRQIFWVCALCAAIPQFHMIGVFYLPAVLLILWLCPTTLNRKWLVVGVVAGLLLYLPYLVGEYRHDWQNTRAILGGESKPPSFSALKFLTIPATVLSNHPSRRAGEGMDGLFQLGDALFGHYSILLALNIMTLLVAFVVLGSFIMRLFHSLKEHGWSLKATYCQVPVLSFLGILLLLPWLLFILTGRNVSTRYAIIVLPLLFMLPILYLQGLSTQWRAIALKGYLPAITVINVYLVVGYYNFMDDQIRSAGTFMPSFRKLETVRSDLRERAGPSAHITLDVDDFKDRDASRHDTAIALRDYIDVHQRYIEKIPENAPVIRYRLQAAEASADAPGTVYRSNGIALVQITP
jgi:4-amino-4-deoxy-L-arabinose transferase-like glycosyltransferase